MSVNDQSGAPAGERCSWCLGFQDYIDYHDREWGVPNRDPRYLFEMIILEGAQAGLSWATILRKRSAYRQVLAGFDPSVIAAYTSDDIDRLMTNPGIVRHRGKLEATVANARAWLDLGERVDSPVEYLWRYVDGRPRSNAFRSLDAVPVSTRESHAMSRDLRRLGFRFVGPTICYAFMQAVGMVNDHVLACPRHDVVRDLAARWL